MRVVQNTQMHIGEVDVSRVVLDPKSRDDIPQILRGLQHLYRDPSLRAKLFQLLESDIAPKIDKQRGRPGMTLWSIFVCGVIRLDLNADYDRLHELVNQHITIRQMLGHGLFDPTSYHYQTLKDNVTLFTPELLDKINQIVVAAGHELVKKRGLQELEWVNFQDWHCYPIRGILLAPAKCWYWISIHMLNPIAGKDYPRTWNEFLDWFATEEACLDYVERLRWPDGFICPACGVHAEPYRASRQRLMCRSCQHQTSVTTDTIFQKTRTPLRVWLAGAWYVTNQKLGVSALGLQRVLGLGSYQTAWAMLHRFRRAMVRPERAKLHGLVEIDETYLAITDRLTPISAKRRKSKTTKVVVGIAVEILTPKGFGRIRLRRVKDDSAASVIPFVQEVVDPSSVVCTDGSAAYLGLKSLGFEHERKVMLGSDLAAHASMPGVHRVASLIKRWILGTHQGSVQPDQLDFYLDEFVFRFNRRSSRSRGMLFYRLMEQAVRTAPVTYADVALKRRTAKG